MGLASRSPWVPTLIYPYLGDALYAVMMYFLLAFIYPNKAPRSLFYLSLSICIGIELLQLYQAPWINDLRKQKLIALVLGSGFLWSDVIAYIIGSFSGLIIQRKYLQLILNKKGS